MPNHPGIHERYDVVVVGGGPAGSSTATLLKKYAPHLSVAVLEREEFPRDHVGESLLPVACRVMNSMGCWDKIEAAGFPVKIGATYRWGCTDELWDFDFLAGQPYLDEPRPARYEGQRRSTAFQVDRSLFDKILLDHAAACGVHVFQGTKVSEVAVQNDLVASLGLEGGSAVTARYVVDASGSSGIVRRALGVAVSEPSRLKNIAVWRYWKNTEWAVTIGASGTRVQVLSIGWGWIWVIPITPDRTSVGLVLPAGFYKDSGKTPAQLYDEAIQSEQNVARMLRGAKPDSDCCTTKDWSFVADRIAGGNWFLVGESAGFADPILAAGISMAMVGAQEAAITISELEKQKHDRSWLLAEFSKSQLRRLKAHIQFADYWYATNAHFKDLVQYTSHIAADAGVRLSGRDAWQWLGTGGFVQMGGAGVAGYSLASANWLVQRFHDSAAEWMIARYNLLALNLEGATKQDVAVYHEGYVDRIPCLTRGGKSLPAYGVYRFVAQALSQSNRLDLLMEQIARSWSRSLETRETDMRVAVEALEAMLNDGWLLGSVDPSRPLFDPSALVRSEVFHPNTDNVVA